MFEDALYDRLVLNSGLVGILSEYKGLPAIFSDVAPEEAERPYVTFTIERRVSGGPVVDQFLVELDYWDYAFSRKEARNFVQYVEYDLDMCELSNDRYQNIRFYTPSHRPVAEEDPKAIHYNVQFDVRATRYGWINQL